MWLQFAYCSRGHHTRRPSAFVGSVTLKTIARSAVCFDACSSFDMISDATPVSRRRHGRRSELFIVLSRLGGPLLR